MTTNTFTSLLAITVIIASLVSCSTDYIVSPNQFDESTSEQTKQYPQVDQRLWSYFEDFEKEASSRNQNIDLVALGITGEIENISDEGVAGTCQYGLHRSSDMLREMIIFHELGHCALGRGHTESANSNGVCLSVMNSGTTDCSVLYNSNNKEYYLDELFSVLKV